MSDAQRVHGIVNGHWEPSPPEPPKLVTLVRTGVATLLQKIAHRSDEAAEHHERHERHPPLAAE